MASLTAIPKANYHVRSISLPSKNHPLRSTLEEQLYRLKSSSSLSPCNKLADLKELHSCVDDFLRLPQTQQALSLKQCGESVENVLDGSLRLLDVCGTTRDVLSQMKECVQQLESSLRRRNGGESGLAREIGSYLSYRKELNRMISKCLKNMKRTEKDCSSTVVGLIGEVEQISLQVFASVLSFAARSKTSRWSVFSKLLKSKQVSCDGEVENEVDKIDVELLVMKSRKDLDLLKVQKILKGLKELEMNIQEAEEELECVFRQLVKTRVSLLNILNN